MRQYVLYICAAVSLSLIQGCSTTSSRTDRPAMDIDASLVDTLKLVYGRAQAAARDYRFGDFNGVVETAFLQELAKAAKRRGFESVEAYVGRQSFYWPDLDTLSITELRQSSQYARIGGVGRGDISPERQPQVVYTFVLFRRSASGWQLAGQTSLEKDRHDRYGYEVGYHETDLPSNLRFPRLF